MPVPNALIPWLDPTNLIHSFGPFALIGVCLLVFAETGLLIGFVFPGDTLLIITGLLSRESSHGLGLSIWIAAPAIAVAAFLGGELGFYIGRKTGPRIFERRESGLFSKEQVDRTNQFFDKYGAVAVVLARFVPIVRTFAPIAAGVGRSARTLSTGARAAPRSPWLDAPMATLAPLHAGVVEWVDTQDLGSCASA